MNANQPIRFAIIGCVNTGIHAAIMALLISKSISQANANFTAFLCAATFSYFTNGLITFKSRPRPEKYIYFLSANGALAYATGAISDRLDWPPYLTFLTFSVISYITSYYLGKKWIFTK